MIPIEFEHIAIAFHVDDLPAWDRLLRAASATAVPLPGVLRVQYGVRIWMLLRARWAIRTTIHRSHALVPVIREHYSVVCVIATLARHLVRIEIISWEWVQGPNMAVM